MAESVEVVVVRISTDLLPHELVSNGAVQGQVNTYLRDVLTPPNDTTLSSRARLVWRTEELMGLMVAMNRYLGKREFALFDCRVLI